MAETKAFPQEKLLCGLLLGKEVEEESLLKDLEAEFGGAERISPVHPFDYTTYYNAEMGDGIRRLYIIFKETVLGDNLSEIKLLTNRLESERKSATGRSVNIDPGLLSINHVILATTKHAGHRIPLQNGIYAELTLHYSKGSFRPMPWTYPDYRSELTLHFLNGARRELKDFLVHG